MESAPYNLSSSSPVYEKDQAWERLPQDAPSDLKPWTIRDLRVMECSDQFAVFSDPCRYFRAIDGGEISSTGATMYLRKSKGKIVSWNEIESRAEGDSTIDVYLIKRIVGI